MLNKTKPIFARKTGGSSIYLLCVRNLLECVTLKTLKIELRLGILCLIFKKKVKYTTTTIYIYTTPPSSLNYFLFFFYLYSV